MSGHSTHVTDEIRLVVEATTALQYRLDLLAQKLCEQKETHAIRNVMNEAVKLDRLIRMVEQLHENMRK